MLRNYNTQAKMKEDYNRELFNHVRADSQHRIYESIKRTHMRNKS